MKLFKLQGLLWLEIMLTRRFWNKEFKKQQQQRQQQHKQWFHWLNEEKWLVLHVLHASWRKCFDVICLMTQAWIFQKWGSGDSGSLQRNSFILCPNTIRSKQAKVHLNYFVRRDYHGVVAKHFNSRKVLFRSDRRSVLNSLVKQWNLVSNNHTQVITVKR